jgi:hypothetical protein
LPEIRAGWIVSGAADPAVGRKDYGRNICAYGIGDIAAGGAAATADSISRAAAIAIAIAIAIAVIIPPAAETEAAIVTIPVITAKQTKGENRAIAVESGEPAAMKAAVKTAAEAASRVSGSGE